MNCPQCGRTACRRCAECGEHECEHHVFVPTNGPATCVCDPMEWADPKNITPVCEKHVGEPGRNCERCEHDLQCHQQPNA